MRTVKGKEYIYFSFYPGVAHENGILYMYDFLLVAKKVCVPLCPQLNSKLYILLLAPLATADYFFS